MNPTDREKMKAQLKRHEGTRRNGQGLHRAYRCTAGALTIGWGHNLDANPVPGIDADSLLNDDQADRLLEVDIRATEQALSGHLPWISKLEAPRYAVLVNMAFNLGVAGLLGFRNTLGMIERGRYADAAAGMLNSKWAGQVKGRARELSAQMHAGEWQ